MRATPNRRTILADRILVVLAGGSKVSLAQCLSKLVNDAELPAEIRIAVAQRAFPDRTGGARPARPAKSAPRATSGARRRGPSESANRTELDAWFAIVSDAGAPAKARRKAAVKLATYILPKKPVNNRWRFTADNYGFAINAEVANDYRDIDLELYRLKRHPNRDFPEIAQAVKKLQARKDAILERLECPCDTRYGKEQMGEDYTQLRMLADKRENGFALTPDQVAEEAHRMARFACYVNGPQRRARRYREDLEAADLHFRKGRFFKEWIATPLSPKQRNDLRLLRWLYPPHYSKPADGPEAEAEARAEAEAKDEAIRLSGHPFYDEEPATEGNFYPRGSKLRPASVDEFEFIEFAPGPRYCIAITGQPPIFSDEEPPGWSNYKPTAEPPPPRT
jgi:hypothetical protein